MDGIINTHVLKSKQATSRCSKHVLMYNYETHLSPKRLTPNGRLGSLKLELSKMARELK